MEISELFNFEKIAKEIGLHSPIFIYGWLLYNLRTSKFFLFMLVISIILSVSFIVCSDYVAGVLNIKKFGTYPSDEKRIVKGISNRFIIMSIMAFFTYAQLANLAFSVFLTIGYLKYKNFDIITLILIIIAGSALIYRLVLLMFNLKGSRQLSTNVIKDRYKLKRSQVNKSKPSNKPKRKFKSR